MLPSIPTWKWQMLAGILAMGALAGTVTWIDSGPAAAMAMIAFLAAIGLLTALTMHLLTIAGNGLLRIAHRKR